jgi:hypothetical protein
MVAGCRWTPSHCPFESWEVVACLDLVTGVAFKSAFKIACLWPHNARLLTAPCTGAPGLVNREEHEDHGQRDHPPT